MHPSFQGSIIYKSRDIESTKNESESLSVSHVELCEHEYTVHGILQARILSRKPTHSPEDLPNLGIEPRSPSWQADSLPNEPPRKPKNTGVGSLSLL